MGVADVPNAVATKASNNVCLLTSYASANSKSRIQKVP
jgi:hypothetical protein